METFIQPKVTGYRQLNEQEAALMNEIKALGAQLDGMARRVSAHLSAQVVAASNMDTSDETARIDDAQPNRWVAIARTDFQTGLMALVRAVAQPTNF
jgi:hypothetical protein